MAKFTVYRREDYPQIVEAYSNHEDMLVVRKCVECGDDLLGEVEAENSPNFEAHCEPGHCGSRPGVFYRTGQVIDFSE